MGAIRAKCVKAFRDLSSGDMRRVGEEFDTTSKRIAEINAAGYGTLVERIGYEPEPETEAEKPAEEKPKAKPRRRTPTKRRTPTTKE